MTSGEQRPRDQTSLVAAAHAVASWARARKAEWDGANPPVPESDQLTPRRVETASPAVEVATLRPDRSDRPAAAAPLDTRSSARTSAPPVSIGHAGSYSPDPIAASIVRDAAPVTRSADWVAPRPTITFGASDEQRTGIGRWMVRAAVAAGVIGAVAYGARYAMTRPSRPLAASPPAAGDTPAGPAATGRSHAGTLHISSEPSGAEVVVDGKPRGTTPVVIGAISVGRHNVEIHSGEGTIHRTVTIVAGQTTDLDEAIYAGWIAVSAPFDVTVSEKGRALVADDRGQIMLRPGSHELQITNTSLMFEEVRRIDVKPGQVAAVSVTPPRSTLTVTSSDAAEVWVDDAHVGAAPVFTMPIDLGTHELLIRRAGGGERRMSVTITTKPLTVSVDFTKPGA